MFARSSIAQSVVGESPEGSKQSHLNQPPSLSGGTTDLSRSSFGIDASASMHTASVHEQSTDQSKREHGSTRRYIGSIASLNTAIAAGVATTLAVHAVTLGVVLPNLILTAPKWLLIYGATVISAGMLARARFVQLFTQKTLQGAGRAADNSDSHDRVSQSLKRLSAKLEKPLDFHIAVKEKDVSLAYVIDRLIHRDVLTVTEELLSKLTDPELDALVAHEINHSNRSFTKFGMARLVLYCFSSPAIFWGAALPVYGALSPGYGGLLAGSAAMMAATTIWGTALVALALAANYISRNNELKTDLRAVKLTGEPSEYVSMLTKVELVHKAVSKIKIPRIFSTHPPFDDRCKAVTKVFGGEHEGDRRAEPSKEYA